MAGNMKNLLFCALLLIPSILAVPIEERDDNCEMEWITVYADATAHSAMPSHSSSPLAGADNKAGLSPSGALSSIDSASSTSAASVSAPSADLTNSSSPGTNGASTTNSAGVAGIPIDGAHLSAPVSNVAVPADAKTYTPPSKTISGKAFETWMGEQAKSSPASKWLKLAPGVYNIDCSDAVVFSFMDGLTEKWTIDLRGVTFLVAGSCQAIYINQCEDLTIYGGTIWFDAGELWTQAKVTTIDNIGSGSATVTCVVEDGYNLTTWRSVGPRNLNVIDASNPNHYTRPQGINFWFASDWNFDNLDSKRTWTMKIDTSQVPLKVGYTMTIETGIAMGNAIASENNGGLHISGFTTNGGLSQYGLGSKATATFENVWYVNAPPRPGFAPRVEGPTLSEGHIAGFDFDAGGQPNITYVNSWWMTTGCDKDLQTAADQSLHDGGY